MFIRVILLATAVLAVSAQDRYSHGHSTPFQSITHHDTSHYNHDHETSYHSSPALIHSDAGTYYRPTLHFVPLTHTAAINRAAPITHTAAVNRAAPITHTAAVTHAAPITFTGAITHAAPITHIVPIAHHIPVYHTPIVHTVPVAHRYSPINNHHVPEHHVAPIVHHATPHYAVPAVTHQYVPAHHNEHQYASHHRGYYTQPKYEFEYSVHDSHTGDSKFQHEARVDDMVNGVYSSHEADGSVRTVNYNTHGHSGFNADVHHSQPLTHVQPAPHNNHH